MCASIGPPTINIYIIHHLHNEWRFAGHAIWSGQAGGGEDAGRSSVSGQEEHYSQEPLRWNEEETQVCTRVHLTGL